MDFRRTFLIPEWNQDDRLSQDSQVTAGQDMINHPQNFSEARFL